MIFLDMFRYLLSAMELILNVSKDLSNESLLQKFVKLQRNIQNHTQISR